jgi:cytochrome c oxidase subunit I+III
MNASRAPASVDCANPCTSPACAVCRGAVLLSAAVIAAFGLFEAADRMNRRDQRREVLLCLTASVVLAIGAVIGGWLWQRGLGIDPARHSYGAAVWTLVGTMGPHLIIGAGMVLWCVVRLHLGMINSWRSLTLRICLLWWRFTTPVTLPAA